jgi:hypothetical protein
MFAVKVGYWGDEEEDIYSRQPVKVKGDGLYAAHTRKHVDAQGTAAKAVP